MTRKTGTPGFVTLAQLASEQKMDPATLRQRIRRGTLPATKVGPLWIIDRTTADRVVRGEPLAGRRRGR